MVRSGFVLAGEHCRSPASFETGIWTLPTLELKGPTTAMTAASDTSVVMSLAPCCGSWTPLTEWSRTKGSTL